MNLKNKIIKIVGYLLIGIILFPSLAFATTDQEGYQFRNDDGSETTATWYTSQDANIIRPQNQVTRLRILVDATGDPASVAYQLEAKKLPTGTFAKVATTTGEIYETKTTGGVGTWTAPAGVTSVAVETWAAGGGGGGSSATNNRGGGGGAGGGYAKVNSFTVVPGTTYNYYVGRGGAAGAVAGAGGTGENSMFNASTTVLSIGGGGGQVGGTNTGGATTTGAVGDVIFHGGNGGTSVNGAGNSSGGGGGGAGNAGNATAGTSPTHGNGGTAEGGNGADGTALSADGTVGSTRGGGGSGGRRTTTTSRAGGAGADGQVRIFYTPVVSISATANIGASGAATTFQLIPPNGKTSASFIAGRIQDDENPSDAVDIGNNQYTEFEWTLVFTSSATTGDTYQFRITANGTALDTYTRLPQWTIGLPSPLKIIFGRGAKFVFKGARVTFLRSLGI